MALEQWTKTAFFGGFQNFGVVFPIIVNLPREALCHHAKFGQVGATMWESIMDKPR
jgi:hypothetical protein